MSVLSLDSRLALSTNVATQTLDDELVMIDLGSETYFGLDEVSTRTWQLIGEKGRLGDVVDVLLTEHEVERERLEGDVLTFAGELLAKKLVSVV